MRTKRPEPVTLIVCTPPAPVVVEKSVVQVLPLADAWIWNARAKAVSQRSTTWVRVALAPRSTWSHWGSLNWLDQRVPLLPSKAADAGVPACSIDDAVAGLPCDSRVTTALAAGTPGAKGSSASTTAVATAMTRLTPRRPRE